MASLFTRSLLKSSRTLATMRSTVNISALQRCTMATTTSSSSLPEAVHIAVVTKHIRITKGDFLAHKTVAPLTKEEQVRAWELFVEEITEEGFISIEVTTEKAQIDRLVKEAVDNVKAD